MVFKILILMQSSLVVSYIWYLSVNYCSKISTDYAINVIVNLNLI